MFYKNGKAGFNGEHSWADAPVLGHAWVCVICYVYIYIYMSLYMYISYV